MITKKNIESFIEKIPPSPKILNETLSLLNIGELVKAAKVAEQDLALKSYLKSIVNKPIYGFKNEVSDIGQIFGILGVSLAQQSVYNYMVTLLSPNKWALFKLNSTLFYELQANLSKRWEAILIHLNINDSNAYAAITLLPASIIVTEALFAQKKEEVALLRATKALDYNTILMRLCGMGLFDICEEIAKKWEMDNSVSAIVQAASGVKPSEDEEINTLGKWMHLLLFYKLSQPEFIKAGLNDFVDFQIEYVSDIYDDFASFMEIK
ncbi:MAG TPA: HDOD domain-containing protein [Sulfurimonas sp.]|uniref:HDOD domain-containing protein n=1 Tax=Sulfurimonas sp. TaxID=2022749 RepID=UPI002C25BB9A|nr:HDOD domain-containing protein [Sulfurimonas sp.]HUH41610.1 HDOD domain-containing protein [Sulfurimonas sp.]